MFKKLIQFKLKLLAKVYLWKFRPKIVAITGSVGKTSTREAVATVLSKRFRVGQSSGNYNNEFGVPLTIIRASSPGKNIFGWSRVIFQAWFGLLRWDYPQVLVLELGTDRPGDIEYLVRLLGQIDVAVITDIGVSHLEFFASPAELMKEKLSLIKKLPASSVAVLNFDSPKVYDGRNQTKAQVIGYGFDQSAALQATDFHLITADHAWGANFKVHYQGNVVPVFLPKTLGKPAVYAALAASAVGLKLGIDLVGSSQALKYFRPAAGRLRVIEGRGQTTIIDDTYNSAPASTIAALEALAQIANGRKVACLGTMAELGTAEADGCRQVANRLIEDKIDLVFLVDPQTQLIKDELIRRKFMGRVAYFPDSKSAAIPIRASIVGGDTVLVKGSQIARMEKIVKELMAHPEQAKDLLVRQTGKWLAE